MKRFLAVFAVLALVVSMFNNVAFATTAHQVYISLDNNNVTYGAGFTQATISGKIFSKDTKALYQVDTEVAIFKDINKNGVADDGPTSLIDTCSAVNGEFSVTIITGTEDTGLGEYLVIGTNGTGFEFASDAYDKFTIMYQIELATPEKLEWTFPVDGQVEVSGSFVNEDASSSDILTIEYLEDNGVPTVATASFTSHQQFGFLFNGENFKESGKIGLFVNGILAKTGIISANTMDVNLVPEKAVRILGETQFTADFNFAKSYLNTDESCMAEKHRVQYTIYKPDETILTGYDTKVLLNPSGKKFTKMSTQQKDFAITFSENDPLGEYTIVFELRKNDVDNIIQKKSLTFEVINPKKYNLVEWGLTKHNVGDISFALPKLVGDEIKYGNATQKVKVKKYTHIGEDHSIAKCGLVEIIIKGCGIDKKFKSFDENGIKTTDYDGVYTISPTQTGDMTVKINVYKTATDTSPIYTVTQNLQIVGWNVTIEPTTIVVGSTEDIVFTITNENGDTINNAIIMIGDKVVANGTTTNISAGTYIYVEDAEDKFKAVQTLPVTFWTKTEHDKGSSGEYMVSKASGINVIGDEVYTVTSKTATLLNGVKETILVTSVDENGDIIYPTYYRINVDADGVESDPIEISSSDLGAYVDDDGVDGKEARRITILPSADQSAVIIRATTDSRKKMGEVRIDIEKPKVVLTGVKTLTEYFTGKIKATLIDPRTDALLDKEFNLVDNSDYFIWSSAENFQYDYDNEVYAIDVRVEDVLWNKAAEDEKDVIMHVVMNGDSSTNVIVETIPVATAKLTADPNILIINTPAYITLTYVDAEAIPIKEKAVYLVDEGIGETDEEGKVVYAASSSTSITQKFKAATQVSDKFVETKVKSMPDIEPPKATIELSQSGTSAIITIEDNVRLNISYVDGEEVDMRFPKAIATHIVHNLMPGKNTFVVQSMDINNNILDTTVTVNVEFTPEPLIIKVGETTEYGVVEMVSDVTMVPVRLVEKLGTTVEWIPNTLTATYKLNDVIISITIGEEYALVNGVQVKLPIPAYINEQERAMVPLRMIAQELGFEVKWSSNTEPITIK
ncbi:copper amine oxidase N-terminal domain-containing protein [Clostridium sp. 'deep sea']|uniref:copper amine oxidase N-terminal domain-containing protein n=1 Tax=Clostridium sp. 'deep sea' TaxID=2779445 RepID=UPI0018965213|nr:copper amine oxidase N-terminal domain-containing protein [Clostridium sp. 'deep sea']QOR34241.1 copper amine oxidase N-terminal domain-containing protein [Clostridium sp. 'deep sea']